jgi:undecaprenyl diphosphate synthase
MTTDKTNCIQDLIGEGKIPKHIAIIMDGNGRWAKSRHIPRIMGHRAGAEAVREMIKSCVEFNIPYLTLYAFSQENWKRPKSEVNLLMDLLDHFLDAEFATLLKEGISLRTIGRIDALPGKIQEKLRNVKEKTKNGNRLTLILALNYGSRREIIDAAIKIIDECKGERQKLEAMRDSLDEKTFARYLYTEGIPDPDLLIRTSGEMRLSNFLLWQCSYSEIHISAKNWPDFKRSDLIESIRDYCSRERRFGAVGAAHDSNP